MSNATISVPLDIPDVQVLKTEITEQGEFIITIESTVRRVSCRKCGKALEQVHDYGDWVTVRHLSILGHPVYLRYRPRRFGCDCEGEPTTTEPLAWREARSPHTCAYDTHLLRQLVNNTVEDVRIKEGLSYDAVLGVIERRIASQVDWAQYTVLGVLGLDEIARRKGHRDFVTIVSARLRDGTVDILGILPDRDKATVKAFLAGIPPRLQVTVHTVCTDMWESFTEAAHEALPHARLVIDRFHVAQHYHQAADTLRKAELKRLRAELPKAEYARLKGSLWAFRKRRADLRPDEQATLDRLFAHSPALQHAYTLREELTALFDQDLRKAEAQRQLQTWMARVRACGLTCFDKFLTMLTHWWQEITNYFVNRLSSGFVEGLNNKLKVLKRRCFGLFNLAHFFQRATLDLKGYRLFA